MSVFQKLKMILTLTCDQSSRLVSDGYERELHAHERAALRCHMTTCVGCKRMRRQLNLLHRIAGRWRTRGSDPASSLSDEARKRIEDHLKS